MAAATCRALLLLLAALPLCLGGGVNGSDGKASGVSHVHISLSSSGWPVVTWSAELPNLSVPLARDNTRSQGMPRGVPPWVKPCVRHGPAGGGLAEGKMATASVVEEWRGRLWSSAEITGLAEGASYSYQCSHAHSGSDHGKGGADREFGPRLEMRAPPPGAGAEGPGAGRPLRLAIVGDLAVGGSGPAIVKRILSGPPVDAAIHLGDIAGNLTDEDHRRGDKFLEMVQPLASSVPYMTLPGDRDSHAAYRQFFRMPSEGEDLWYSLALGPARLLLLCTQTLLAEGDAAERQLAWLEASLVRFSSGDERRMRPWLIVAGHRPLYCSLRQPTCGPEALRLRKMLEPLLRRHRVDLHLSSHLRAYERTWPVANGSLCPGQDADDAALATGAGAACAPVYIVNGDAGTPALEYETLPARWTAHRHPGVPGHGELTVHNRTHLQYRQLQATGGPASDEFWLLKPEVEEKPPSKPEEENFLEAIAWLAFATMSVTGTCTFIRWSHGDGLKRRYDALRHLRVELAVLSGVPSKVLGSAREVEQLVRQESGGSGGLH